MRQSFPLFAERAWREVDSAKLVKGAFLGILWSELQAWGEGRKSHRKVILAQPPGSAKSLSASVLLQAWMWTRDPSQSCMAYASTQKLAVRDTLRSRDLITSEWYRERFWEGWELHTSQQQKLHFANTAKGERFGIGGQSRPTGWRGDNILIDDPVDANPRRPPRPEDLDAAYQAVQYLLRTRINDPEAMRALLIMQRLHEDDPVGRLLQAEPGEWKILNFDAVCDPAMPHRHPRDRRKPGEVLLPERGQTREKLEKDKEGLGSDTFNAQYQQQPAAAGGMIIKPGWFQRWVSDTHWRDEPWTVVSWDCAFKGEETSSWVVGTVWKVNAPDDQHERRFTLVDIVREHLDYAATKRAIERLALRWPEADFTVIEDKANGPAVISELKHKVPNIVAFNPNPYGSKEQRLRAVSPIFEQGRVWIPAESEWVDTYISELTRFPKVSDSDQVDSTSQVMLGCTLHLEEWIKLVKKKSGGVYTIDW